jgi:hypothetical protein
MSILDVPGVSKAQLEKRIVEVTADNISARDSAQAFAIDALSAVVESHAIVLKAPLDAKATALEEVKSFEELLTLPAGAGKLGALSPTGLAQTIQQALSELYTRTLCPEDFGAKGDGIADDTLALIAAEAAAYATGCTLLLKATYRITQNCRFRRQFRTNGAAKIVGIIPVTDTAPTIKLAFERRMEVHGLIMEDLIVLFGESLDGSDNLLTSSSITRNHFLNCDVYIGQPDTLTFGYTIQNNTFACSRSRLWDGLTIQNASLVTIESNHFQSFRRGIALTPTRSFSTNGITIRDNEIYNCVVPLYAVGSSMNRISNLLIENNIGLSSVRDANSINNGGIVALWCCDLKIIRNQIAVVADCIKVQACVNLEISFNVLNTPGSSCIRSSGCAEGRILNNQMWCETSYPMFIMDGTVNNITTGNYYVSDNWLVQDNTIISRGTNPVRVLNSSNVLVKRNTFKTTGATGANGLLQFSTGCKSCRHLDNLYYAASGTAVVNNSGAEVTEGIAAATLTVVAAPVSSVTAPVITAVDAALDNAKSYVTQFTVGHYSLLRQLADDTAAKGLSAWAATISAEAPKLMWNSCAWNTTNNRLPDIIVNGLSRDNFGMEDWWWARSMMVIDRQNRLSCRDFMQAVASTNLPAGIGARQLAENAWQTVSFRAPLVVNGAIYDPLSTGLFTSAASFDTAISGRTCLGQKADGTYVLLTVDGVTGSSGTTMAKCAAKLLALGCVNAMNLDGGGSATLWYNGALINSPSDGNERNIPACMYVV